jgi:hypothetical protein
VASKLEGLANHPARGIDRVGELLDGCRGLHAVPSNPAQNALVDEPFDLGTRCPRGYRVMENSMLELRAIDIQDIEREVGADCHERAENQDPPPP